MERDTEPIQKPEGDVDGDNLILNPQKAQKKIPTIDLKKNLPRELEKMEKDE